MSILLKKFAFWFVLFSILICFINLSGNDDKNILIFITNPINQYLLSWLTDVNTNPNRTHFFKPLLYLLHLTFWGLLGLTIDILIMKVRKLIKNKINNKKL